MTAITTAETSAVDSTPRIEPRKPGSATGRTSARLYLSASASSCGAGSSPVRSLTTQGTGAISDEDDAEAEEDQAVAVHGKAGRIVVLDGPAQPAHPLRLGVLRARTREGALGEVDAIDGVAEQRQEGDHLTGTAADIQRPASHGHRCVLDEQAFLLVPEPPEVAAGGVVLGPVGPGVSHRPSSVNRSPLRRRRRVVRRCCGSSTGPYRAVGCSVRNAQYRSPYGQCHHSVP
ncbi:hypothetical protein ACFPN6_35740 [Streptomyces fimbriatus]|uniref:Uncharacterized protein n=1 Tax=Streptomyces fimbriatus TaxID=68197 RepID=A0ABW0DH25_STRFI